MKSLYASCYVLTVIALAGCGPRALDGADPTPVPPATYEARMGLKPLSKPKVIGSIKEYPPTANMVSYREQLSSITDPKMLQESMDMIGDFTSLANFGAAFVKQEKDPKVRARLQLSLNEGKASLKAVERATKIKLSQLKRNDTQDSSGEVAKYFDYAAQHSANAAKIRSLVPQTNKAGG